jgi:putative protease
MRFAGFSVLRHVYRIAHGLSYLVHMPEKPHNSDYVELLAPAGDWDCVRAAIENGADAIYFGLDCGFNARHRARNFGLADLAELTKHFRRRGVRGYVTLNTLVFPSEMAPLVDVIVQIAEAGVDAVLVQDFGVARLVREICPDLEIHASTQMSLTSAETIQVAGDLGLSRVVLARELSVPEIRKISVATDVPLEVFIHGALCVAYSGQCLTSESLGGRSANRGQCAQACRLPYELVCDGEDRDLNDVRFLLSPQDLAGYAAIPDLIDAGVHSLKIEGRLKTPEYVANITCHYRKAIDEALTAQTVSIDEQARREMELSFSRGFSSGWLEGNNHKRLVPGRQSAKRGIELGTIIAVAGEQIQVQVAAPVALGDGLAIAITGDDRGQGGRVYSLADQNGTNLKELGAGQTAWIGFGHGEIDWTNVRLDATVFKNDDPKLNRRLRRSFSGDDPVQRQTIDIEVVAETGSRLRLIGRCRDGQRAEVFGSDLLAAATKHAIDESMLRDKLGRLGGTPFVLGNMRATIVGAPMVPMAVLNQTRRDLVAALITQLEQPPSRRIATESISQFLSPIEESSPGSGKTKLVVLCRTLEQLKSACESKVDLIYADFHDIRQYREAIQTAHERETPIGLATIRMQKPGEGGLLRVLGRHRPDWILARNLAAMDHFHRESISTIADFSLNVSNHRSAEWIRSLGADRITPSYDLNRQQLVGLVDSIPASWIEVVIHQHMPMFHMEHCVFCAVMSPGTDKTNCGRPCDRHQVQLRDRVGAEHTLQADVACRNTLYNATPQSGAETVGDLISRGVEWFRVELLEENARATEFHISLYRRLLEAKISGREVWQQLKASNRVGVTRGTLESKRNPLEIL